MEELVGLSNKLKSIINIVETNRKTKGMGPIQDDYLVMSLVNELNGELVNFSWGEMKRLVSLIDSLYESTL